MRKIELELSKIVIIPEAQSRMQMDSDTIAEYSALMDEGVELPPVIVYHDGESYYLADGFHRYEAANEVGYRTIAADIREGTARDAILFSVGANAKHGLRRTIADKRKAVQTMLNDREWSQWSDRKIAEACNVSHTFASKMRSGETGNVASDETEIEIIPEPEEAAEPPAVKKGGITRAKKLVVELRDILREYGATPETMQAMLVLEARVEAMEA